MPKPPGNKGLRIVYTRFANSKVTQGALEVLDLPAFAAEAAKSYKSKHAQPLCVPDQLPDNSRASGTEPIVSTSIFLDFDKPELTPEKMGEFLERKGLAYCLYPTYSYAIGRPKYRVVLPLAAPIEPAARRKLILRIMQEIPGIAPESLDNKRGYFVGRNGSTSFEPMWKYGKTAEKAKWPAAPVTTTEEKGVAVYDHERMRYVLSWLDPDTPRQGDKSKTNLLSRHGWLGVSLALHAASGGGKQARDLWIAWSSGAVGKTEAGKPRFPGKAVLEKEWGTYGKRSGLGEGTLVAMVDEIVGSNSWDPRYGGGKFGPHIDEGEKTRPKLVMRSLAEISKKPMPRLEAAVNKVFHYGSLILVAGPPKGGKSWLLYNLGLGFMHGGIKLFAVDDYAVQKAAGVLHLSLEDGEGRYRPRIASLERVLKVKGNQENYQIVDEWPHGLNAIEGLLELLNDKPHIRIVMIDTLEKLIAMEGEQGGSRDVKARHYQYTARLAELAKGKGLKKPRTLLVLLADHTKKSAGKEEQMHEKTGRTQGLLAGADGMLVLDRVGDPRDRYGRWQLVDRDSPEPLDLVAKLVEGGEWRFHQTPAEFLKRKLTDLKQQMVDTVAALWQGEGKWVSADQVNEAMGREPGQRKSTVNTLCDLKDRGLLRSLIGKGFAPLRKEQAPPRKTGVDLESKTLTTLIEERKRAKKKS